MKPAFALLIAALVSAADLVSKTLVFDRLGPDEMLWVLGDRDFGIGLTESLNRGVTGGLFQGVPPAVISILTGIAVLGIAVYLFRSEKIGRAGRIALALILGGAAGNLADRVWFGHVRDFLDVYPGVGGISWLEHWPTFNVADAAIVVGVGFLIFQSLFLSKGEPSAAKE